MIKGNEIGGAWPIGAGVIIYKWFGDYHNPKKHLAREAIDRGVFVGLSTDTVLTINGAEPKSVAIVVTRDGFLRKVDIDLIQIDLNQDRGRESITRRLIRHISRFAGYAPKGKGGTSIA